MTLYEELYYQLSNLPKFYRFEGPETLIHYSFKTGDIVSNIENYIYFSANSKHHFYYAAKKLKQLIEKEMLYETKNAITKKVVMNTEKFQEIIKKIENAPYEEKAISIELVTSPLMNKLLLKNCINNAKKEHGDYHIERVDHRKRGGGYGFCGDWLNIFHTLTYLYVYQKVTKEDLIEYMYAFRGNIVNPNFHRSPAYFLLNPNKRVVMLNQNIENDFSKYELLNSLQMILESKLYLPNSYLGINKEEGIKKIMQMYSIERENIFALLEENYKRRLKLK